MHLHCFIASEIIQIVAMHALLLCKIFVLKIRSCKFFDKSHVWVTKGNKANQRSDLGPKKVRAHPRLQEKRRWPTKLLRQGCHQHYITRICHLPWVSCRCVSEHSCVQKKYQNVIVLSNITWAVE